MTTRALSIPRFRFAVVLTISSVAFFAGCFVSAGEGALAALPCETNADCGSEFYACTRWPDGAGTCEVIFGFASGGPAIGLTDGGENAPRDAGMDPMDPETPDAGTDTPDAGTEPPDAGIGIPDPTWAQVQAILTEHCASCHTQSPFQGNFQVNSTNSYTWIQDSAHGSACSGDGTRVIAGNPGASILWNKINGTPTCGQQMPPSKPLNESHPAEAQTIFNWISQGAKM
jgi:hypothetical protein